MTAPTSPQVLRGAEERRRMELHPEVEFRDGPAGRRAAVRGGVDVWQIMETVRDIRIAGEASEGDALVFGVVKASSANPGEVRAALAYAEAYPAEIDEWLVRNAAAEAALLASLQA